MFYHIPPSSLYQEYQLRVEESLRKGTDGRNARPVTQTSVIMWNRFRTWAANERERIVRALQPAEEGYIA